jgi:AraC-like DNA-binding protein
MAESISPQELVRLFRSELDKKIAEAEAGKLKLRLPKIRDRMALRKGLHLHYEPEVFLQLGGTSIMSFPQETLRVKTGEVLLVPRGMPHIEHCAGDFRNLVLAFHQDSISVHLSRATADHRPRVIAAERFSVNNPRLIWRNLDELCNLLDDKKGCWRIVSRGLLLVSLGMLLDVTAGELEPPTGLSPKIVKCRHLVIGGLSEPELSVKSLAQALSCSADYLSHLFHLETGETLVGYINRQRIDYARHLLEHSSLNISEVAYACGYADPGYFARLFRRETGHTPRQFRQEQAG